MRILFCGTPWFAVPSLKHLLAKPDFQIAAVITQPDRPRGRGQQVSFSPVKEVALARNIPVFQPEKIRTPESEQFLREAEADAIVIIAFGQIIPARLLAIPRLGWINLHASLLPKYRGAAPIQWAVANGESVTGITTMRIDVGMDTGDILHQRETHIAPTETTPQLAERLAEQGAPLITDTLRGLRDGSLAPKPQDHSAATLAPLLKKEDGLIDWQQLAQVIYNRMRGFAPWPGAYTSFRGTTCHLLGEPVSNPDSTAVPGQILYDGKSLVVACGQQSFLQVSSVKLEGRKQVSATDFANGAHVQSGEHFGRA
ncbi:MAG TPA: methionyl-tRNA formyltransferase [Candidatus Acidoferrum sp.]|nr:methionyl-tRNA formyltransferase [Candidatus Acidoferrum sp.]